MRVVNDIFVLLHNTFKYYKVMVTKKEKFFISYTRKDQERAMWIGATLRRAGYETMVQVWDFKPGMSFVSEVENVLKTCDKVIAVLSNAYLDAYRCRGELTASYIRGAGKFIPVRIEDFKIERLWRPILFIDFCNKNEEQAKEALLTRVSVENKPSSPDSDSAQKKKTHLFNLPEQSPSFTGQEEKLAEMHRTFEAGNLIALTQSTESGDVENSNIALEYVYRHLKEYDFVWWVNAETNAIIEQDFTAFAKTNHLVEETEICLEDILGAVKKELEKKDNWLVIFDNAEDEKTIATYHPQQLLKHQHLLITYKSLQWDGDTPVKIDVFQPKEAMRFLSNYNPDVPKDKYQSKLAEELGYLPPALEQAAAYIKVNGISYRDYLDLYNGCPSDVLNQYPDNDKFCQIIYKTWKVAIDSIADKSSKRGCKVGAFFTFGKTTKESAAKQLLNLCAFFAPNNIDSQWFKDRYAFLPKPLRKETKDKQKYNNVLTELARYSLIKIENNKINIHRLLQQVIRDSLRGEESQWILPCLNILHYLRYHDFSTPQSRDYFRELVPHILSIIELCPEKETLKMARLCHFLGYGFNELADYPQALKWYLKTVDIREKIGGKDRLFMVATYSQVAIVYYKMGKYDEALKLYQKTEDIYKRVFKKENTKMAVTNLDIATVHKLLGNYDEALEYYLKVLSFRENRLGKDHPKTATICDDIAALYGSQGKYDEALEWSEKALAIREKLSDKNLPSAAISYRNMAEVCCRQEKYDEALKLYQKMLAIYEKELGKDHLDTATTYNNIADVYNEQGKYDEAMEWYQKTLAIRETLLGKEHADTASTCSNIAAVYDHKSERDNALEWHFKTLAIREKVLDKDHPDRAVTYSSIAVIYLDKRMYAEAAEWYQKTLDIYEKTLGTDNLEIGTLYDNIASIYCQQGKYDKALELQKKALAIREKGLEKDHPDTATTYSNLALVYLNQNKHETALKWNHKALAIREKAFGKDHLTTSFTYIGIALVYDRQGKYKEALEWYLKGLAIQEKELGKDHLTTAITYNDIVEVYEHQGKYVEALELGLKVVAIYEKEMGKDHPQTATTYNNLAGVYCSQGRHEEALAWYYKAIAIKETVLGKDHTDLAITYNNIAKVYRNQENYDEALKWLDKAYQILLTNLGPEHPQTLMIKQNMRIAYNETPHAPMKNSWRKR
jgi:pentatricopeptide repeat protein